MLLLVMAIISSFILFRQLQSNSQTTTGESETVGAIQLDNPVNVQDVTVHHVLEGDVSLNSFAGKTVIAFFGYTNCPDICPITLMDLAEIYQGWGEPENVQIMMITVDAKRDTPEIMQRYVENFHRSFLGFSGDDSQIVNATKSFFVGFAEQTNGLLLHTDSVFVIDEQGMLTSLYGQDKLELLSSDLKHLGL